ncbi:MAG: ABC-2 transporter permease [Lachnospiraceae bacterium]|nr:ABC-2 transporter permease [Lachnospiraceae bacterium]
MKGLLVKDFCLLRQRIKFFILLFLLTIFMTFSMDSASFAVGWVSMLMAILSLSTLSYDEYDNCMPFLMSLPASPRDYALEKYCFSFLCGLAGWIVAVVMMLLTLIVQGKTGVLVEELLGSFMIIPVALILPACCIPVELKWGAEKGRMYLLVVYGIFFALLGIAYRFLPKMSGTFFAKLDAAVKPQTVLILLIILAVLITAVSVMISFRIVDKKEY